MDYFTEQLDSVKKQIKVMEFQKNHRDRLVKHFFEMETKYQESQRQLKEMEKKCQLLQEENTQLKVMLSNNRSGGSQRSGKTTPIGQQHSTMGTTPSPKEIRSLHTPSPASSQRMMTTPTSSQKGRKEWQPFHPPSGPTRLLVRPPPCNGKIISPKAAQNVGTPGVMAVMPNQLSSAGGMDGHRTSPMSLSPVYSIQQQRPGLSSNSYTTPVSNRTAVLGPLPQSMPQRLQKQQRSPQPMAGVQHGNAGSGSFGTSLSFDQQLMQSQPKKFISIPSYTSSTMTPSTAANIGLRPSAPSSVPPRIITLSRHKVS